MPVTINSTPNPNALKFGVGTDVGPPSTFTAGVDTDDPMAAELLGVSGVTSIFMSADFVTITKDSDADWESIASSAQAILEAHFG